MAPSLLRTSQLFPKNVAWGTTLFILMKCLIISLAAFQNPSTSSFRTFSPHKMWSSRMLDTQQQRATLISTSCSEPSALEEATKLKAEADLLRLEAERMDISLTIHKIGTLERKLGNKKWLEKHRDQEAILAEKLECLRQKLLIGEPHQPLVDAANYNITTNGTTPALAKGEVAKKQEQPGAVDDVTLSVTRVEEGRRIEENPLSGFDEEDLIVYVPVAREIENNMSNATMEEKLQAFRTAPELQDHFKKKIQTMLVQPMEDMQRLDQLKSEYLSSMSSTEKNHLKREITCLEKALEGDSPFLYSDSVYIKIPPMGEDEMAQRLAAVGELPSLLQAMYKLRTGVKEEDDLRLAIEVDHYEPQLQLLEQLRLITPLDEKARNAAKKAIHSLPTAVRNHLVRGLSVEDGGNVDALIERLSAEGGDDVAWGTLQQVMGSAPGSTNNPEYEDIEFLDRSRFVEELYPSIARLEDTLPLPGELDRFLKEIVDHKSFMVSSKPERVVGGYYLRGENQFTDDVGGSQLVNILQERLDSSSMNNKLEFFYLNDPSPATEEQIEVGYDAPPLILVTSKNPKVLYNQANPVVKAAVSLLGLASVAIYSLGVCELEPFLHERLQLALLSSPVDLDLSWITDITSSVALSMLSIQLIHETAHRLASWRHKFDIGLPTPIASFQLGLLGSITPIKSPPPDSKSLFDFAIAGPLAGMAVSVAFLVGGLARTASIMELCEGAPTELPALPNFLLQSSTLGSGLIEYFLGKGAVVRDGLSADTVLPLHPFAISGFVGLVANALALLPLGQTDGGRISVAMFGRRGAYIVQTFTAIILCAVGLFGFDNAMILLTYVLFTSIWQREPEAPARNEVEELDFIRGLLGIAVAVVVALVLMPVV